jgi:hypothetical protein
MVVLLFIALFPGTGIADDLTPEKREDIKKLMTATGADKLGIQMAEAMFQQIDQAVRSSSPNVSDRVLELIRKEMLTLMRERIGGLLDQIVPIYAKYLSHQEIKEIQSFFQSAIGRKMIEVQPQIARESVAAGAAWGGSLEREFDQRIRTILKREGIDLPRN